MSENNKKLEIWYFLLVIIAIVFLIIEFSASYIWTILFVFLNFIIITFMPFALIASKKSNRRKVLITGIAVGIINFLVNTSFIFVGMPYIKTHPNLDELPQRKDECMNYICEKCELKKNKMTCYSCIDEKTGDLVIAKSKNKKTDVISCPKYSKVRYNIEELR